MFLAAAPFASCNQADSACVAPRFDEIARVRYVHDGDTVHLHDGRKLRLIGINAPELARDDLPEQAFAREARELLDGAIASSGNRVGVVYGTERHDRYKRTLAHLFSVDGKNLQALLLERGMAAAIAHPPNLAFTTCYEQQEQAARCRGAGIWADPAQSTTEVARLGADRTGFARITGKIESISHTDKGVRIIMDKLVLGISPENLVYFDLAELKSLRGRRVTVQGWLHPLKARGSKQKFRRSEPGEYYMNVRHPSAIQIGRPTGGAKC